MQKVVRKAFPTNSYAVVNTLISTGIASIPVSVILKGAEVSTKSYQVEYKYWLYSPTKWIGLASLAPLPL